jgi:hypothetical protein
MSEEAAFLALEPLEALRKGLRSCLACRTAFPNRLGVLKHQLAGCRSAPKGKK